MLSARSRFRLPDSTRTPSQICTCKPKVTSHKLDEEVRENKWRRDAINRLLWAFYVLNGLILLFIAAVWWREATVEGAPHIVTERLLLTLVGASTVQLGALAGFVGRSLAKRS